MHVDAVARQSAMGIADGTAQNHDNFLDRQWLELENLTTADQCIVDGEVGVGGCHADQAHNALFNITQQRVLLRLVKAVDLVDKQQCSSTAGGQLIARLLQLGAQVLHAVADRTQLTKSAAGRLGQQSGERRLPGPGWPVKNCRADSIRVDQPRQ